MSNDLTTEQARKLAKRSWKNRDPAKRGGRPKVPTSCPKCGAMCPSERLSRVHCVREV